MFKIEWANNNDINYSDNMHQEFKTFDDAKKFYDLEPAGYKTNQDSIVDLEEMEFFGLN